MIKPFFKTELNLDTFNNFLDGEIFAHGIALNSKDEIFAVAKDIGRKLRWVAKKGYGNDFAVYMLWADESTDEDCKSYGDKLTNKDTIKKLLNCEDAVLQRMRR